jgi:hypothetical protein
MKSPKRLEKAKERKARVCSREGGGREGGGGKREPLVGRVKKSAARRLLVVRWGGRDHSVQTLPCSHSLLRFS